MKKSTMTIVLPLLVAVTWGRAAATDEAIQPIQFQAYPASLLLAEGEEREITWVLHNPNKKDLLVAGIRSLRIEGVTASLSSPPSDEAPLVVPGLSDSSLVVKIRRTGELRDEQKVYLQLDCRIDGIRRMLFDCLTVGPRMPVPVERIASLSVEAKLDAINEHCPGWVYLVVTNKSAQPMTVGPARVLDPQFESSSPEPNEPFVLAGQDTKTIPIKVCVGSTVQPGSRLLVFDVPVTQVQDGREQSYHLMQKHPVNVGIMGESEVLKALQVPSFLLLPGVLAVMTGGLLWGLFREASKKDKFPLPYHKEGFWVVAVTISILVGVFYPYFTQWCLGQKRNYLYGYGLADVIWVWLLGIATGLSIYILIAAGVMLFGGMVWCVGWLKKRQLRRDYPTAQDDPEALLSKLHRQGLSLGLTKVRLTDGQELFLLQKRTPDAQKYWLSSEITIALPDNLDPATEGAINGQLVPQGDPETLLRLLSEGNIRVLKQAKPPKLTQASEIQAYLDEEVFVRIAT